MQEAYVELRQGWDKGDRRRERSLHLLFLSWMHWADPPFVTGMSDDPRASDLWHEIFTYFGGENSSDPEFLAVAGMMAEIFPWALGDEKAWAEIAKRMKSRSLELQSDGFPAQMFEGRGDYGEYFAGQAKNLSD